MKTKRARVGTRLRPVVGNRVKCKACGLDIHIDHFAGVCGGDFYCDSILCLLVLSDPISNSAICVGTDSKKAEK
jgi:hypothetical protein